MAPASPITTTATLLRQSVVVSPSDRGWRILRSTNTFEGGLPFAFSLCKGWGTRWRRDAQASLAAKASAAAPCNCNAVRPCRRLHVNESDNLAADNRTSDAMSHEPALKYARPDHPAPSPSFPSGECDESSDSHPACQYAPANPPPPPSPQHHCHPRQIPASTPSSSPSTLPRTTRPPSPIHHPCLVAAWPFAADAHATAPTRMATPRKMHQPCDAKSGASHCANWRQNAIREIATCKIVRKIKNEF